MLRKIDYSDISIITHIRVDNKDRVENYVLRNNFFEKYCSNLEFVTIEDDIQRKTPRVNNEIYHLTENSGRYNKNKSYNMGFKLTERQYVLFLDVDCILEPNMITNIIKVDEVINNKIIYPYSSVLYLKNEIKEKFKRYTNIESLIMSTSNLDSTRDNDNQYGRLFTNSCGGAILCKRDIFESVNGFNPNFNGWGYEDSEFRDRLEILGNAPVRLKNNIMFHLPHGEHYTNRYKESIGAIENKNLYNKIVNMSREECEEYIKTWTI